MNDLSELELVERAREVVKNRIAYYSEHLSAYPDSSYQRELDSWLCHQAEIEELLPRTRFDQNGNGFTECGCEEYSNDLIQLVKKAKRILGVK